MKNLDLMLEILKERNVNYNLREDYKLRTEKEFKACAGWNIGKGSNYFNIIRINRKKELVKGFLNSEKYVRNKIYNSNKINHFLKSGYMNNILEYLNVNMQLVKEYVTRRLLEDKKIKYIERNLYLIESYNEEFQKDVIENLGYKKVEEYVKLNSNLEVYNRYIEIFKA